MVSLRKHFSLKLVLFACNEEPNKTPWLYVLENIKLGGK